MRSKTGIVLPGVDPAEIAALRGGAGIVGMDAGELAEVMAVDDPFAQYRQLAARLGVVGELVERDEDVPRVGLPDHLPFGVAPFDERHEMEAARAAHRFADLPYLESEDGVGEHGREIGGMAPAEVAAFERLLSVGMGHCHVREVRSSPDFAEHALGAGTRLLDLLGGRAVGNRDQDVSDPESMPVRLRPPALQHRKIVVDVTLRDVDLVLDPAPAHLRYHDLFPDLLSKLREIVAVAFEGVPELAQREFVLLCDPENRLVEPLVVDANARIACKLQLEPGEDHSLEHLPAQCVGRRRSRAGLAKLLAHPFQPGFQLARTQ